MASCSVQRTVPVTSTTALLSMRH